MKKAVPFLLAALALPACMSADDERKERAEEIEKVYGLKPADARGAAAEKFDLTASQAENDYERVAKALGMKRLFTEDVTAFIDLENKADADRKKILDDLVAPAAQDLVKMLRESFQYEPRFKDAEALIAASEKPATFKLAC